MTAPAVPATQTEFADWVANLDFTKVKENPDSFRADIQKYAGKSEQVDPGLGAQIAEGLQKGLADFLKENNAEGTVRPDLRPEAAVKHGPHYNERAAGVAIDNIVDDGYDYLHTLYHHHKQTHGPGIDDKITKIRNASFASSVPYEGGFLIPEILRSELLRIALEKSIMRSRARVIPMDSLRVPFPAIDTTTNATSVYGGIVTYWTEEGAALTQSAASFSRVVLDAKKLTAYTAVPNELVADSTISFDAFIGQIFPEAMAFQEDFAFIQGTSAGEPLGILAAGNGATVVQAGQSGQFTKTIVWENVVNMYSRMLPQSLDRAVWLCSPDTLPQLYTMGLAVGTGGGPIFMGFGEGGQTPGMTLLGRPLIITEKAPALGTQGCLSFVDIGMYLIGDRMAMTASVSDQYLFGQDLVAFRLIERVDGRPWVQSAITPANGSSNTLSPYVQLAGI